MIKQTLTWTALPRGSNGPLQTGTELRLSVYVAPRLWDSDANVTSRTLADYPDWLDWPALVAGTTFEVAFDGGPSLVATPENVDLRTDLWQALFKTDTTVRPYAFEQLSGTRLSSFSARGIHATLKNIYRRVASDPAYGNGSDLPDRDVLGDDPDIVDIAREVRPAPEFRPPPDSGRGPIHVGDPAPDDGGDPGTGGPGDKEGCLLGCLLWPLRLLQRLAHTLLGKTSMRMGSFVPGSPGWENSSGIPNASHNPDAPLPVTHAQATAGPQPQPRAAAAQAYQDLHTYMQNDASVRVPLPNATDIEDEFDFHKMISSLGDYPALMRRLGLVVDLVVTLDTDLPANPGKVRVLATAPLTIASSNHTPDTRYELAESHFVARARSGSDLRNGYLRLNDSNRFEIIQTELAGSGLKLQNTATNVRGLKHLNTWPRNAPRGAGLPAMQTAGVSIARANQVDEVEHRFDRSYAMNLALASIDNSAIAAYAGTGPAPVADDSLWADDLVRGYRIDVWDDRANDWRSLCRRIGTYEFLDDTDSVQFAEQYTDEGFVQLAVTESLEDTTEREFKVHESLFTWDGWSLVAPRPGLTIMPDDSHQELVNEPHTQFRLRTAFVAEPGTLPRQRFGWLYRLRARLVDMAGNSVLQPDTPEFAVTQPEATQPIAFHRYEPAAPPTLAMRAAPSDGEAIENLVVRSTIHDAAAVIAGQSTERHVVPPKTSQQMVERHGRFDATPAMLGDQAGWELGAREAASMTERVNLATESLEPIPGVTEHENPPGQVYFLYPGDTYEVAFLPDEFARGVLFMGLPGMPAPNAVIDGVNRIAFGGTWPDTEPLRIALTGLEAGAAPAQPGWDATARLLTVQVPQGETVKVRYSSYLDVLDLDQMAVWAWVREFAPANLADLETLAAEGRNWLLMPYRELRLVHAVQQPLTIPDIANVAIVPARNYGATEIVLDGQIDIDAKSTGKLDVDAQWSDPLDDPADAANDPTTHVRSHAMPVTSLVVEDPTADSFGVANVVHTLGDTRYHRVTYTAVGTTRYREYFPTAAIADIVRPEPVEVGTPPALDARFDLDVPNAARPAGIEPVRLLPIVSWSETEAGGVRTRVRTGGGLRLYMERPWYSSGAGELVGLVLRPDQYQPVTKNWKALRKYVSEWGMDPIWRASETAPLEAGDFANAVATQNDLTLGEISGLKIDVAGFEPTFDADQNLWLCDIALQAPGKYFPFVRLALARYQPISVDDAHVSRVVMSDYAQLLPHRRVDYDLNNVAAGSIGVRVSGPAYFHRERKQFASPIMVLRIERRVHDTGDELGWQRVSQTLIPPVQQATDETVWEATVSLPTNVHPMRIVVLEGEVFEIDRDRKPPPAPDDNGRATAAAGVDVNSALGGDDLSLLETTGLFGPDSSDNIAGASFVGADARGGSGSRIVFADAIELP